MSKTQAKRESPIIRMVEMSEATPAPMSRMTDQHDPENLHKIFLFQLPVPVSQDMMPSERRSDQKPPIWPGTERACKNSTYHEYVGVLSTV